MRFELRSKIPMTFSVSGDSLVKQFRPVLNVDGSIRLVEDGDRDIYIEIQKDAESTSISLILAELAVGNAQHVVPKQYGDYSQFPKDLRDVLQFAIDAEHDFNALDVDTKREYNNSWTKWTLTHKDVEARKASEAAKAAADVKGE